MTRNTSAVGQLGEIAVMQRVTKAGWQVLIPYGNSAPYDLVAEKNGRMVRLQIRTTRSNGNFLQVNCRMKNNRVRLEANNFDFLIVYELNSESAFVIPVAEIKGKAMFHIRLKAARSGQVKLTHPAADYCERWEKLLVL